MYVYKNFKKRGCKNPKCTYQKCKKKKKCQITHCFLVFLVSANMIRFQVSKTHNYNRMHNLVFKTTNERYKVPRHKEVSLFVSFFFLNLPKKKSVHLRHSPLDTKPLMSVKRAIISKIKTFVYHASHILNSV